MAFSSRKRSFSRLVSEERLISITLAEGAALSADKLLLQVVSECAAGLPGDAAEWDLSSLLVEGQPVSRAVVVAWLHAATMLVHNQPFPGEQQQQELPAAPLNRSAAGLAQLLAFADAVGSTDGMLRACLPPLEQLRFRLQEGEKEVQLDAATAYAWHVHDGLRLVSLDANHSTWHPVHTAASDAAKAQLSQQFACQLEALLYLAHRLELDSLAQVLHACVRYNTAWVSSLIRDNASTVNPRVLSARVLEAAAGPGQHSQRAFINSIVAQPVSFVPGFARRQVLRPLNLSAAQKQPIKFAAELTEDFVGAGSKGQSVEVELDLLGKGVAKVGADVHVAQLLLGPRLSDEAFGKLAAAHQQAAE